MPILRLFPVTKYDDQLDVDNVSGYAANICGNPSVEIVTELRCKSTKVYQKDLRSYWTYVIITHVELDWFDDRLGAFTSRFLVIETS